MSQARINEELPSTSSHSQETSYQNDLWHDVSQLNPASDPWFPYTQPGLDIDFQSFPDLTFDPTLLWSNEFMSDLSYLPMYSWPEPAVQRGPDLVAHQPTENIDEVRKDLNKVLAELMQVKGDLEKKVQMIAE
jgi:hypothetical protein